MSERLLAARLHGYISPVLLRVNVNSLVQPEKQATLLQLRKSVCCLRIMEDGIASVSLSWLMPFVQEQAISQNAAGARAKHRFAAGFEPAPAAKQGKPQTYNRSRGNQPARLRLITAA